MTVAEGMTADAALDRADAILADDAGDQADRQRRARVEALGAGVIEAIKTCYDPEIPVNIYELGLIYKIDVDDDDVVHVDMTLTSPNCPVAESLPIDVQDKVKAVDGVKDCEINLVWDPPWHPSMMTEAGRNLAGQIF